MKDGGSNGYDAGPGFNHERRSLKRDSRCGAQDDFWPGQFTQLSYPIQADGMFIRLLGSGCKNGPDGEVICRLGENTLDQ